MRNMFDVRVCCFQDYTISIYNSIPLATNQRYQKVYAQKH